MSDFMRSPREDRDPLDVELEDLREEVASLRAALAERDRVQRAAVLLLTKWSDINRLWTAEERQRFRREANDVLAVLK